MCKHWEACSVGHASVQLETLSWFVARADSDRLYLYPTDAAWFGWKVLLRNCHLPFAMCGDLCRNAASATIRNILPRLPHWRWALAWLRLGDICCDALSTLCYQDVHLRIISFIVCKYGTSSKKIPFQNLTVSWIQTPRRNSYYIRADLNRCFVPIFVWESASCCEIDHPARTKANYCTDHRLRFQL